MLNKEKIIKNFSKYAHLYDFYSDIQKFSAIKLIKYLNCLPPKDILEIGCGTANYTKLLHKKFPSSFIDAIDISVQMIEKAKEKLVHKNVNFYVCDGENIKKNKKYDLITSNMCFQWFVNLEKSLLLYKDLLRKNGYILFSTVGPLTFYELNCVILDLFGKDKIHFTLNFKDKITLEKIMKKIFKNVLVEEIIYKRCYTSVFKLFKHITYTGSKGDALVKHILTPTTFLKLQNLYKQRFGKIIATYQIYFCRGNR
ncbi:MAG: methyltransferase domain-containing protein [Candidatus Omnitrophica bacterium]|nr:methyltransferase domain-containing protein [Candidatus Omnitrophota bacterium]MCM8830954.1 methyltransferase domain-containing protein [Candidatus Omnitrophota bacterium]